MRVDIAYSLATLLAAGVLIVVWLTRRYHRYRLRKMRGHYDKPVWKPFWIN